jgi:uncharacterized protein (TIGR03083 family)
MSQTGVAGLQAERDSALEVLKSLTDDEWNQPSACAGWSVRAVVAHMGSVLHGVIDPSQLPDTAGGTEPAMEIPVAARRDWSIDEVLAEYESFSEQVMTVVTMAQEPPMSETTLPLGDLGTHPMSMFGSMFCFDVYCHLRHDILQPRGPIDRPEPPRDETRVGAVVEWMLAGLPWMSERSLTAVDRPFVLRLTGPGGGEWTVAPGGEGGRVLVTQGAATDAVAVITSDAHDFVAWATHRRPWSECVTIEGDERYASAILDAIHIF